MITYTAAVRALELAQRWPLSLKLLKEMRRVGVRADAPARRQAQLLLLGSQRQGEAPARKLLQRTVATLKKGRRLHDFGSAWRENARAPGRVWRSLLLEHFGA